MSWSFTGSNTRNSFSDERDSSHINQEAWRQRPEFYQSAGTYTGQIPSTASEVYRDPDLEQYINQLPFATSVETQAVYQNTRIFNGQDAFAAFGNVPTSEATPEVHQSTSLGTQSDSFPPRGLPELPPSIPSTRTSVAQPYDDRTRSNDTATVAPYWTTQQGSIQPTTERTAKGERIPCPTCGKVCKRKQELARHQIEIHEQKKNPCPFCPMVWTRAYKIRAHLEQAHPNSFSTEMLKKIKDLGTEDLALFLRSFSLCRDELITAAF